MELDLRKTFTDAAYITVGVGVLGFQHAQVRRREISKALGSSVDDLSRSVGSSVDDLSRSVGSSVDELRSRVEPVWEHFEPVLEHLQSLPGQVRSQVRDVAQAGRERIVDFVEARSPLSPPN